MSVVKNCREKIMGWFSVTTTFAMNIMFNIILPTVDIGSDVYLLHNTLTFNLGDSLEMAGCRACFGKTDDDVYKRLVTSCTTCTYGDANVGSTLCGQVPSVIDKLRHMQSTDSCEAKQAFRVDEDSVLHHDICGINDYCCIEKDKHMNVNDSFEFDDRRFNWLYRFSLDGECKAYVSPGDSDFLACLTNYGNSNLGDVKTCIDRPTHYKLNNTQYNYSSVGQATYVETCNKCSQNVTCHVK